MTTMREFLKLVNEKSKLNINYMTFWRSVRRLEKVVKNMQ